MCSWLGGSSSFPESLQVPKHGSKITGLGWKEEGGTSLN